MDTTILLLVLTLILCYVYAFVGGFTDAANAIATSVGTRALSPTQAVIMAGVLEVAGALTGTAVALTIGKGIVSLELISLLTVTAALLSAMSWSLFTYYFGIPVSETHGLIGAIIGAAIGVAGINVVIWGGVTKVLLAIVFSPILGFLGGFLLMGLIYRILRNTSSSKTTFIFINLQRLSSAFMAFSHGLNDAQKPMGAVVMALTIFYGWKDPTVPVWVILSVGLVAGMGVAYGGWRIIKTLGMRITSLTPDQGFAAEISAAGVLQLASSFGIPVSTTHTITTSIVGAGVAKRFGAVRWKLFGDVFISWTFTLPTTMALGWIYVKILQVFLP